VKFCSECGEKVIEKIPDMDDRLRFVCPQCDTIHYQNPKMVVGSIPAFEDKVLLCKRAIEPMHGAWTLPAGFMENAEETLEAAVRETYEEAGAKLSNPHFYRLFDLPSINQVYLFYRADLVSGKHSPGIESLETQLFTEDEIPWDQLAFPVIYDVLKEYFADRKAGQFIIRTGPPNEKIVKEFIQRWLDQQ